MKKTHATSSRVCLPALLFAFVAWALALGGEAQTARERDLVDIRARVADLESQLAGIRERRTGLVGELVEADYELQLQVERLAEARRRLDSARLELEAIEQETAALEQRLEDIRGAVRRRVVGLYRKGGRGAMPLLMSVRATDDVLAVLRSLRFLVRRDVELRRSLNETRSKLELQLRNMRLQRLEVEQLVDTEAERLAESRRLRQRRAALLAEVERRELEVAVEYGSLVDREGRLADLLGQMAAGGEALAGRPIQDFRGVLDRPIVGSVVRAFGPRRDPRYKTLIPHNGLQFAGLTSEKVRVVYPGRVLYAADLEGYGDTVIIRHPGRVFTLYAGLAGIEVGPDELLSLGQVIGTVDGGLYFEVREENRPVDPAEWIR